MINTYSTNMLNQLFLIAILFWVLAGHSLAQSPVISGLVIADDKPILGAQVALEPIGLKMLSDASGRFSFRSVDPGSYVLTINYPGFFRINDRIEVSSGDSLFFSYEMVEDALFIHEMVVTVSRKQIERHQAPVVINTISSRTLEAVQAVVVAEGLSFTPGLRVENNCQNCGFNQLRMNGLDGAYSQILINSRPVYSALAGVYGLEILPANMVDRIEVVRGGGSVLYGGNAIAGTVNIITKGPLENSYELAYNQAFTGLETPDRTLTFNASLVNDNLRSGVSFFAFNRDRKEWDANGDGFSELTKLNNTSFGIDYFRNGVKPNKLKFGLFIGNEFRRGGNNFHLEPHQTDLTEQLKHLIVNNTISYETQSKNRVHSLAIYSAGQAVFRSSYYGSGGRVLSQGDSLTETDLIALNAYGMSDDLSLVGGLQYVFNPVKRFQLIAGSEMQINQVSDLMSGYNRRTDQKVETLGSYLQCEWTPHSRLTLIFGGRLDLIHIEGKYKTGNEVLDQRKALCVPIPRLTGLFRISEYWKLRSTFSQGYRAPQAFNEDLHIETVGGDAKFIRLSSDLKTERSNSATLSINFDRKYKSLQISALLEGFYTQLKDPFILSDQEELENGVVVITKRNGSGAFTSGINLEFNMAYRSSIVFQSGGTIQKARYDLPELIWSSAGTNGPLTEIRTTNMLRTPDQYAYFSLLIKPSKKWDLSLSGIYTGSMIVSHTIDPETEKTILKSTPRFFEKNAKISYNFNIEKSHQIQVSLGIQNIFNSYQSDFDSGMERDAGYVFGPNRPRTMFMSLKFSTL